MPATYLEDLDDLAESALADLLDGCRAAGHPTWIRIYCDGAGGAYREETSGLEPPYRVVVPSDCVAVGIVATGRLWAVDPTIEAAADMVAANPRGIGLAHIVDRSGRRGWSSTLTGGATQLPAPSEGAVVDVLRRMLGLPTPPPPCPVDHLPVVMWLDSIQEEGAARGERLSWSEAQDLRMELGFDSWEDLRQGVTAGFLGGVFPSREMVAWMDDGMFARQVVDLLPDLADKWEAARRHLTPAAARSLSPIVHAVRPARRRPDTGRG